MAPILQQLLPFGAQGPRVWRCCGRGIPSGGVYPSPEQPAARRPVCQVQLDGREVAHEAEDAAFGAESRGYLKLPPAEEAPVANMLPAGARDGVAGDLPSEVGEQRTRDRLSQGLR